MQVPSMSTTTARPGVTVRLDPALHARLQRIAKSEHRSVAAFLETLVEREIAARDAAERVIRVHVAPELAGLPQGDILPEPGESDARHARRGATLKALFGAR